MLNRNLSDEELIEILKQDGNARYFTVISERYEEYILKKCLTYVKEKEVAEDLCQEILLKIFFNLKNFKGSARFKTWLFTIVHNSSIDYLRKNKKNVRQVMIEKISDEVPDLIMGEDDIPRELTEQILNELLDTMSPDDKLLLLMKYKEKYSIQDIMLTLNLSESAVKMRLKRAKERINTLYLKLDSK